VWRTRRWARDLPDLVVVGTPFERWSALGKRHSRPAGAAPLQGTARPTVATCTAQLATAQPARHRNTARRDSVRVSTTRHGTAQPAWRRNTARNETGRNGAPRQVSARDGTGRDGTARLSGSRTMRHAHPDTGGDRGSRHHTAHPSRHRTGPRVSAPHGTPIPTQDGTAGLGTTRHTHPDTGRDRGSRHHTAHPSRQRTGPRVSAPHGTPAPGREGRASLGTPSTAQEGTASLGITAHPARRGVASQPGTSRHRRSAFGVRRSARHRSPRRINITHQRKNAPSRERRGVLVDPGVSRW